MNENILLRQNIDAFKKIIEQKDSTIAIYKLQESQFTSIGEAYETRIGIVNQQHELTKKWAGELSGKLRKQRRKTFLTAVVGVVATAASIYFLR